MNLVSALPRLIAGAIFFLVFTLAPGTAIAEAAIESTLDDIHVDDVDNDGEVDRGDTIEYRVMIRSTGDTDSQTVEFNVPLSADLNLVPGSLLVGPIALDDRARVAPSGSVVIPVLDNDRDIDGFLDPATVIVTEEPTGGTVMIDAGTGDITYTAAAMPGMDTFRYTVTDDDGLLSRSALVSVMVNDCPVALDDAVSVSQTMTLTGNVFSDNGNGVDTDPDAGDAFAVSAVNGAPAYVGMEITLPSGSRLTQNADGTFVYDPNGAFDSLPDASSDTDTFTYTISDGLCDDTATVTITINGENDCPVAQNDTFFVNEDATLPANVFADNGAGADADSDTGATLTVIAVNGQAGDVGAGITLPSGATLTLNSDGGFTYDPNNRFNGLDAGENDTDTFTYTITDGTCSDTATATITINGENDCPIAQDDAGTTDQNTPLNGDIFADNGSGADSDPDTTDTLTVTAVNGMAVYVGMQITLPSGALLTLNSNGAYNYDPNGSFENLDDGEDDTDTFTYTISDGICPQTATVTITIDGVNDCPAAEDDAATTDEDTVLNGNVLSDNGAGADRDADTSDTLTITQVNGSGANVGTQFALGSGALLTLNSNGTFSYDPNGQFEALGAGQESTDSFSYTISDGTCTDNATVNLTITGINDAPSASAQSASAFGNIQLVGNSGGLSATATGSAARTVSTNLLMGASDADTATGSLSVVPATGTTGQSGAFQVFADGSFTYAPPAGFTAGNDTFTYTITDGADTSASATVTVGVSDLIWFIDNTGGGSGGSGTATDPFKTIGAFNTANGAGMGTPAANSRVYLLNGDSTYTTGISLLDNQVLEGEGTALIVGMETIVSAGTAPVIGSATNHGITLAQNNTIRGLDIANTPGFFKISGGTVGNLSISDVALTGTGGGIRVSTSGAFGSNVTFDTLESTSSPGAGIDLTGVSGILGVTSPGTGISGSADGSPTIDINGGSVSMTYTGTVSKDNGGALVQVRGGHASGTLQFQTGTLDATSGTGLQFDNADGTYTFSGTTTLNGGDAGIDILNGSDGTFTFSNTPITNPSGTALVINGGAGSINHTGTITKSSAGLTIDIQSRSGGTLNLGGVVQANSGASGIRIQNNTGGTFTFSSTQKTLATGTATGLDLSNNSGATIQFTNGGLDIDTTNAIGINASASGTLLISGANNTVDAVGNRGLDIDNTALTVTLASLTSTSSSNVGIDLSNIPASSTFTVTGTTTITGPSGSSISIDGVGAGATFSFANVSLVNRASHGIFVQNHNGNSITFGDVDIPNALSSGGNGVTVQSTGAATTGSITFDSLDISNTNSLINRNDGGSDAIPDNDTDDGHGIRLRDHTGGFTITGSGGQGNGGTIQNIEGDGISLVRSGGLNIDSVTINNIGTSNQAALTVDNAGIFAWNVVGSNAVKRSTISRFQDGNVPGTNSRGVFITNVGTSFTEFRVTDTTFFNDNTLRGDDGIFVNTINTVNGALVVESLFPVANGNNRSLFHTLTGMAVQVLQNGGGTFTSTITNSTFRDAVAGSGLGGVDLSSVGSGTMSNSITGSNFHTLCPAGVTNGGVVNLFAGGTVNFDATVNNCDFGSFSNVTSAGRGAIRAATGSAFTGFAPRDFDITITNNTINATAREAITVFVEGGAVPVGSGNTSDIVISGNNIGTIVPVANDSGFGREGIEIRTRDSAKNVTITLENNNITNFVSSPSNETVDIDVEDSTSVVAIVRGNTFSQSNAPGTADSIDFATEDPGSSLCLDMNSANNSPNNCSQTIQIAEIAGSFTIEDIGGVGNSAAAVQAFIEARNTGTASVTGTFESCNDH